MTKLRTSLSFRGYPDQSLVTYYDGEQKDIFVDQFHLFWDLLEALSSNQNTDMIQKWKDKHGVSDTEYALIMELLDEHNLLEEESVQAGQDTEFLKRNLNFFRTYGWNSDAILNKLSHLTIAVIGAGTVGASIAYSYAKMGVGKIIIYDSDDVEAKNVPAQFVYDRNDIGNAKVDALKQKIYETNPHTDVVRYNKKVEDIQNIEESLSDHQVDYIFSCFDDGSIALYRDLINKSAELGSTCVVLGYAYDMTVAYVLDESNIDYFLNNSIISFDKDFLITENRGMMLQSLIGSFLGTRILLGEAGFMSHERKEAYTFNVKTMEFQMLDRIDEIAVDDFTKQLNAIYPVEEIPNMVAAYREVIRNLGGDIPGALEVELLSLQQFFTLLINIDGLEALGLEKVYQDYVELLGSIDEAEESQSTQTDDHYVTYMSLIQNMSISVGDENEGIYSIFNRINQISDEQERKVLQEKCFTTIKEYADVLLGYFVEAKKPYIEPMNTKQYVENVFGCSVHHIDIFNQIYQEQFESLTKRIYEVIFPNQPSNQVDFLYFQEEHTELPDLELEEGFKIIRQAFQENNQAFARHNTELEKKNAIKQNHANLNRTFYFPQAKENRIIIDFNGSYNSLFTLAHEIGHSYFNKAYNDSFFDDSYKLVNESLANYKEIRFLYALLNDKEEHVDKNGVSMEYLHRLNKTLLSSYSIYVLENQMIHHIRSKNTLSVEDFLQIQEVSPGLLLKEIRFMNRKHANLNVLLNPGFVFDYQDHIQEPVSFLLGMYLHAYSMKHGVDYTDYKIKTALANKCTQLDSFCKFVFGMPFHSDIIRDSLALTDQLIQTLTEHLNNQSMRMGQ
ncbi:ThiF family protein [Oceanobacillus limi]|uniref:ThiF family protein n=1 Tax=Oceanobacillus limi TaxID=930131 RepID=A0A1H9XZN6_9BACI|nr:ThiF family adenylyltransferase [Oceanobacillus limi]SES61868.1 ThiF family protein [Oceanobacillus limi]